MSDLINFGINFGFALLCLGVLVTFVICIIRCSNNNDDDNHYLGSSNDHVIITIKELVGLKSSLLRSISVIDFNSKDFKDVVECVVCLSELADGDKVRVLPSCKHWFHADCIDSWFQSHSTCPICRKKVGSVEPGASPKLDHDEGLAQIHNMSPEPAEFQTNPPSSTNMAVIEDHNSNEANEVRPDVTAVVVDIPAIEKSPTQVL